MKPNCFFLRLDRLDYNYGYYKVLMGLTEDILGSASLWLQRFCCILPVDRLWGNWQGEWVEFLLPDWKNHQQPWLGKTHLEGIGLTLTSLILIQSSIT
ncbi:MAG: hypothetical protein AAFQ41_08355 [Cyanobacteria bacterium J06623_7]